MEKIDLTEKDLINSGAKDINNLTHQRILDDEKSKIRGQSEQPEKKQNTIIGIITEIDKTIYETREQVKYIRFKISNLWFSLFENKFKMFKEENLKVGDKVKVQYWCSDSDFGRTYRNINIIKKYIDSEEPKTIVEEIAKIKSIIESQAISIEGLGNAFKKFKERLDEIEEKVKKSNNLEKK